MAELCLDCLNQRMNTNDPPKKFVLSRQPDLCEECGRYKPVIIRVKLRYIAADWLNAHPHRRRR